MRLILLAIFLLISNTASCMNLIRDSETESIITQIASPLVDAAGLSRSSVKFYIINSDELNAFVMGGQNVFVTTGLISYSKSPEVLAGVIAHELGHITGGHLITTKTEIANTQKKMIVASIIAAAVGIASQSPEATVGGARIASDNALLHFFKFNRAQESAADITGLKLLKKAHYTSEGLLSFLNHLEKENRSFNDKSKTYLSTHPLTNERLEFIKSRKDRSENKLLAHANTFKNASIKIKAFTTNPNQVLKEFNSTDNSSLYATSIAYFRLGSTTKALEIIDQLIKNNPKNPYYHELKGQFLFESNMQGAANSFKKSSNLKPKDILFKLNYATALIAEKKDLKTAVTQLEHVLDIEKENIYAWHQLSLAQSYLGNKNASKIALAWATLLKGDVHTAKKLIAQLKHTEADKATVEHLEAELERLVSKKESYED